jgi:hypothetical protein
MVLVTVADDDGGVGSDALDVRVAAPASVDHVMINDGAGQRSMVESLTVTFSQAVTLDDGAFDLVRPSDQAPVSLVVTSSEVDGKTVAQLTFTGRDIIAGSLADGRYRLTIHGDRVHDDAGFVLDGDLDGLPGGDYVDESIHRLFGDTDGDGDVDNFDYFAFRRTYGKKAREEGYLDYLDFNGDGVIDQAVDFVEFAKRKGKRILPVS